jgi:hypothetical protein
MEEIKAKIKKNKLNEYTFENYDYNNLNLTDNVILYNSGNSWKIIPLNLMLSYPIIHDEYLYEDEKYDITIVMCPITLRCVMFKGKFEFYDYEDYRMVLKDGDEYLPIDLNKKINEKFVIEENKRIEVKIMTLRNAIIYVNDVFFIKTKHKTNFIINAEYYENTKDIYNNDITYNSVHPKTLVYVAEFESQTEKKEKFVILLGNDYSQDKITGYDVIKSKLNDHLLKYRSKIIKKDGYIMPMLWYIAKDLYKNYKLVYLK